MSDIQITQSVSANIPLNTKEEIDAFLIDARPWQNQLREQMRSANGLTALPKRPYHRKSEPHAAKRGSLMKRGKGKSVTKKSAEVENKPTPKYIACPVDDVMINIRGRTSHIEAHGKSEGWSKEQIAEAVRETDEKVEAMLGKKKAG